MSAGTEGIKQERKEIQRQLAELQRQRNALARRDGALVRALKALESTEPTATTGNGKPKRPGPGPPHTRPHQDAVRDGYGRVLAWFQEHGSFEGNIFELAESMGVKKWRVYAGMRMLLDEGKLTKEGRRYELVGPERVTNVSPGEGVSEGRLA